MTLAIFSILAGLVLLALGAEGLVRGSSSIALRLGVTPLVIGLTIVAAGTGSPEMIVSLQAAASGSPDLALGNIVGSNIANLALILGIAALVRPLHVRSALLLREVPVMIVASLALFVLLADGALSRVDGLVLIAGAIVYTVGTYRAARRETADAAGEEFAHALPDPPKPARRAVVLVVAGLLALLAGAQLLVHGAIVVAQAAGLSEVVIGLTVVAIGTSLPELATSVVAAWRGDADVSFGNALGSNILNILLILGVVAAVAPVSGASLRPLDLGALLASALLIWPLMWRGRILSRGEGALLVAAYAAYLAATLMHSPAVG